MMNVAAAVINFNHDFGALHNPCQLERQLVAHCHMLAPPDRFDRGIVIETNRAFTKVVCQYCRDGVFHLCAMCYAYTWKYMCVHFPCGRVYI